jgi:hypothetical protein
MVDILHILIPTHPSRQERLKVCLQSIKEHVTVPHEVIVYENERGGFVPAIHDMLEKVDGIIWAIGDDTVVVDNSVDILFKQFLETYPEHDGVVQPDDGIQHGAIITMPLCHSKTLQKYTFKGYNHWYADNEFTEIMQSMNLYTYLPDCVVDHIHWANKKVAQDESYNVSLRKNEHDHKLYLERKANNYQPRNEIK